jgi:ATP-dependent RNA circularization protein (DNA/RNA ligase family)
MEGNKKGTILEGEYADPIFANMKNWLVTEKIHGENVRIMMIDGEMFYRGRTDNSQVRPSAYEFLKDTFPLDKMQNVFNHVDTVVLYGELCGAKINGGKAYSNDFRIVLFDVLVMDETGHEWWLEFENVTEIANKLEVEHVFSFGVMTEEKIIELVQSEYKSAMSEKPLVAEGVVCTAWPMVLNRRGEPVKFKLKARDYRRLKYLQR